IHLSGRQEGACRQRVLTDALAALAQLDHPREVVCLERSEPLPPKQGVILAPRHYEKLAGLVVLLDRFVRSILPLQQEGVARNALGGLLCRNGTKKPVVDGQRFAFILRIDQQIKQHAVIHGSAVGLVDARIEITQGLRRFNQADRKSTRLNSSHQITSYAVLCLIKKMRRSTWTSTSA